MTAHNSPPFATAMEVQGAAVHTGIGVALRAAYHERRAQERDTLLQRKLLGANTARFSHERSPLFGLWGRSGGWHILQGRKDNQ